MYKKLIALVLTMTMVFCSGVPAFASEAEITADAVPSVTSAVSEDPFMLYDTEVPEIPEEEETPETAENTETVETAAPADEDTAADVPGGAAVPDDDADLAAGEDETAAEEDASAEEDVLTEEEKQEAEETARKEKEKKAEIKYRNGLAAYMRRINPKLGKNWSRNLAQTFIDIGEKYDLDPKVLMALAQRESRFYSKAKSPYGYKGMMQTSDWLAKHYGYEPKDVYDYEVSIDVAARYLRNLKKSFGTYTLALCGYMYGGTAVKNGRFSKKGAWKVMDTRSEIQDYLEKWNFV